MAKKKFTVNVNPDDVMYSNISKSKEGYNSARMVVKVGEKDYMSINYEWEGEHVPDFAMSLMSFMQSNEIEMSAPEDYGAAKSKKPPFWQKDDEKDDKKDGDDKKKSKKDDKKKKDKKSKKKEKSDMEDE